jgi:uncharacterized membrane protein
MAAASAVGATRQASRKDTLARTLGWFSLGVGVSQIAAPKRVARAIGMMDADEHDGLVRAVGVRELATGLGILSRPRPASWLWARVAGDAMDIALLTAAVTSPAHKRTRVTAAIATVAGIAVPDVVESTRLSRSGETWEYGGMVEVRHSVTVDRSPEEAYRFWRDLENLPRFMRHLEEVRVISETQSHWKAKGPAGRKLKWNAEIVEDRPGELIAWRSMPGSAVANSGTVRFRPAPGGRGTEVMVEFRYAPPGGPVGAALARLFGEEPATQTRDDLRRFKQVIETGEVLRSEAGTGDGPLAHLYLRQSPARPVEQDGGAS